MAINFPDSPSSGDTFTDATSGFTFQYNGTVWRSFDPSTVANIREIDDISGDFDGSDTTFTLKVAGVNVEPANVQQLIISVGGVMQNAGQDYTVSGSTLTFTTAPTSGLTFFGTILGTALALNTVSDDSVGSSSLKSEDFTIGGSSNTVTIPGNLTVQGTETIINTNELNVQDKTIGIGSTNAPTSATQDGAGAIIYGQTHVNILYDVDKAALGINTGVSVAGFVTATGLRSLGVTTCGAGLSLSDNVKAQFGDSGDLKIFHDGSHSYVQDGGTGDLLLDGSTIKLRNAGGTKNSIIANDGGDVQLNFDNTKRFETASDDEGGGVIVTGKVVGTAATIGLAVTINNTGIDAGIGAGIITAKTYFGDATNMTGAGSTFQALSFDPFQGKTLTSAQLSDNIVLTFNHGIEAGNAAKEVQIRKNSVSGEIVQSFGVGSSITYSAGQAIINPTDALPKENTFFVVVPEGAFKKIGTASSSPIINTYSFESANFTRATFTVGANVYGQLMGNDSQAAGGRDAASSPVQVGENPNWEYASIQKQYGYKAILLAKDPDTGGNSIWSVGYLQDGQSGTNVNDIQYSSPTQIGTDITWRSTVFGDRHVIATKTDGTLWGWGYGDDGALGLNQSPGAQYRSSPIQIGTDTNWSDQIFASVGNSAAIKTDGTLWTWGSSMSKGMGAHNSNQPYSSPKQVGTDTTWSKLAKGGANNGVQFAIKTNGTLWTWGWQYNVGNMGLNEGSGAHYYSSPTQVGTDTTWHSISITNQDEYAFTLGLKTDGSLWSWGQNNDGYLGLGNEEDRSSPTQIGTDTTWGNGIYNDYSNEGDYTFTAGGHYAAAVKTDGTLWTWGENSQGNLGHNNRNKYSSPKQVGTNTRWGAVATAGYHQSKGVSYYFERN